jgi:purine-binding chemotaxis protein CheW
VFDKETLGSIPYLTFSIYGEEYAVTILNVKEIIEFCELTRIPQTPKFIRGVLNLRGNVVPVLDLAVKFGLPESQITKWTCIVILEVTLEQEKIILGIIADVVNQVIHFATDDIEPTPTFGTKISSSYIIGMGKVGKKFTILLNINKVITIDDLLPQINNLEETSADNAEHKSVES